MKKKSLAILLSAILAAAPVSTFAESIELEEESENMILSDEIEEPEEIPEILEPAVEEALPAEEETMIEEIPAESEENLQDIEHAQASISDYTFTFNKSAKTAEIHSYSGSSSSLTLPSSVTEGGVSYSVTSIRYGAFRDHTELEQVTIPSSIVKIGSTGNSSGAFEGCKRLSKVTIQGGNQRAFLGGNTFNDCSSLTSISIPGNYSQIHYAAFRNCTSLKSVSWTRSTTGDKQILSAYAFDGCKSLTNLSLPTTLNKIEYRAFQNCTALPKLTLPEGLVTVEYGAFQNCTALTTVTIPSTMEQLGSTGNSSGVFEGCTRLATVSMAEGNKKSILGGNTFNGCKSLTSIRIPGNYYQIHYAAFRNCISLKSMSLGKNTLGETQLIAAYAFDGCKSLTSVSLPTTLNKIEYRAFQNCTALPKLTLPEGLVTVEYGAFQNCTALTTVTIPSTIEQLGSSGSSAGVFEGCTRLTTVSMTEGNRKAILGGNTFNGCTSLTAIRIPGNYYQIHYAAFRNCISLKSMSLGKNTLGETQLIAAYAFDGCKSLTSVSLPTTLNKIEYRAFQNCTALPKLTLPEGLVTVEYGAFQNCTALTTVTIPSTMEQLGSSGSSAGVFEGCKKLSSVTMKSGRMDAYVGGNCFNGCTSLRTIVIPGNYSKICYRAFSGCTSLLDLTLQNSSYSYQNQEIDAYVVDGCSKLINFQIPKNVGTIDLDACKGCTSLTIIGTTNSTAHRFAKEQGIKFRTTPLPIGQSVTLDTPALSSAKQSASSFNVTFTWKPVTKATHYYVYRKTGTGSWKKIATVNDATSYVDKATKTIGTTYTYTVRALGGSGTKMSGYHSGLKVTVKPFTPVLSSAKQSSSSFNVTFTWKPVTKATHYYVYRKTGTGSWKKIATVKGATSYMDKATKTIGTTYTYTARALGGSNNQISGYDSGLKVTVKPFTPVLSSAKQSSSSFNVTFTWKPVTKATHYYVYRKTGTGSWKKIATVKGATRYVDKATKTIGTTYTYTARALGGSNNQISGYDSGLKITVKPFTPVLSSAKQSSSSFNVTFTWKPVTKATQYYVYRKTGTGSWKKIATVKGATRYVDKAAKKVGTTYTYTVRALGGSNNQISGYDSGLKVTIKQPK